MCVCVCVCPNTDNNGQLLYVDFRGYLVNVNTYSKLIVRVLAARTNKKLYIFESEKNLCFIIRYSVLNKILG